MRGRWNGIRSVLFYVITVLYSTGAMTLQDAALLPETETHHCFLRNRNMAFQTPFCVCFSFWLSISMVHRHKGKKKNTQVVFWSLLFCLFSFLCSAINKPQISPVPEKFHLNIVLPHALYINRSEPQSSILDLKIHLQRLQVFTPREWLSSSSSGKQDQAGMRAHLGSVT